MPDEAESGPYWVISLLVTGGDDGVDAVSAEMLLNTALLNQPDGCLPIASTVARFADLSAKDQDQWRLLLQREIDDWG